MSTKQTVTRTRSLKGKEALLEWSKQQTEGYKDVDVRDLNASWRDGLAFCALLHRFNPELLDFESLSKDDAMKNNELAFKIAQDVLKVPALLDAEDLVSMKVVDELSVMTYVSMLYKRMTKRMTSIVKRPAPTSPTATSPTGQTRRTLFDVLKDENNFSEIYEKRRNRLSSGEVSPTSKTSKTRSTSQELEQENQAENEFK